ncbi:SAM-dependent methyltransferase [Saccharopolyspora terrae]|uniref:SAM-dependent methyltransferase n=1 Tax=Saccharopolyspora terrae TaxID=2530384 RepID=A0A4R4V558_9PSEU|nr:methyltransferase [Saccharopolyspora terrae]TDC99941.1 SAM-dependent methyltransferase [Saccharopolyspora terrae]
MTNTDLNASNSFSTSLIDDALSYVYPAALRTAALLGIADYLATGPLSVAELAHSTNVRAESLYRILRVLATKGVFTENQPGVFAMTPQAEGLSKNSRIKQGVLFFTEHLKWRAVGEIHHAVANGEPSFNKLFGTGFWEYAAANPEDNDAFNRGMAALTELETAIVVDNYIWPETGTIIDLAGGHGGLLLAVLQVSPGLRGVLFDREHVLAEHVLDVPDIAGRWETRDGDFFAEVPSGDVYLIKNILHDWSDDESVRILQNCANAANPGARVLAIDAAIPRGNEHNSGKLLDLIMLAMLTGRERTTDEVAALFVAAGLRVTKTIPVPGTTLTLLEGQA